MRKAPTNMPHDHFEFGTCQLTHYPFLIKKKREYKELLAFDHSEKVNSHSSFVPIPLKSVSSMFKMDECLDFTKRTSFKQSP